VSQANLDNGLMQYFGESKEEIYYGSVRIQPLAYQDDMLKGSQSMAAAQVGIIRMATMLRDKTKLVSLSVVEENSKKEQKMTWRLSHC
jgi:trehalose-6-phosphate synthase